MKILALETSTQACSAALLIDDNVEERFQLAPRGHGDLILGQADELMAEAGLRPQDLDAVAFGRGPGAFTGVRIATAVAQGIAFAADLPVAPVSTLAALAQGGHRLHGAPAMLCAMDARMDEIYWGVYQVDQGVVRLQGDERVCPPGAVIVPPGGPWFGMGNGWQVYSEFLESTSLSGCDVTHLPHAQDVARLGAIAVQEGAVVPADQALPVYLRDNVAEKRNNNLNRA